ncbi:MAG: CARDB domain-containing protein [Acidobacteriota bacterium]
MKKLYLLVLVLVVCVGMLASQGITVNSPAAGVTWVKGQSKVISWSRSGCSSQSQIYKINIFRGSVDPANFVEQLTANNVTSKQWTVPTSYTDGQYVIRVKTDDSVCKGDSGVFTINGGTIITFQPVTVQAHFIKTPDLKMTIIPVTGPTTEVNKKTLMEFKVDNIGEGESKATKMRVFMGQNNTDTWDVKSLKPGRFMYKTKEVTPDGPGYYMWSADVDHDNKIGDSKRQNNFAKYKMIIKGSDLVVAFDGGIRSVITTTATVKGYVRNNGKVKSTPCKLKIYMEKNGTKKYNIPALNPGEVYEVARGEKYYIAQTITVKMTIDSENDVKEENEKNNYIQESIKIVVSGPYWAAKYFCSNGKSGYPLETVW